MTAKRKEQPSPAKRTATKTAKKILANPRTQTFREDQAPYRTSNNTDGGELNPDALRFIDLFCGIGGFRIAFEKIGGKCVFSSDWDKFSQQTYEANFGEKPHGDIHAVAVALDFIDQGLAAPVRIPWCQELRNLFSARFVPIAYP